MDTQIQALIAGEYERQQNELEMIASENYVSKAVMEAYANVYTNKYSEGYPSKRYYGWQERVDKLERVCQRRALAIFWLIDNKASTEHDVTTVPGYSSIKEDLTESARAVNVQPLSGSPANLAVYLGCLQPGDTILWMDLGAGGHLTHGHPLNASGIYYKIVAYGVTKETSTIDYDDLRAKALEHKPQMILAGFSAYPRTIDRAKFAEVADAVEAKHGYRPLLMADIAHIAGLIAGGATPWPFHHFDIVTTTTHKTLRWPRGGLIYMKKGKVSRNSKEMDLEACVNRGLFPGMQGGPHEHIIAAKAVAFGEILYGTAHEHGGHTFAQYAQKVIDNSKLLGEELMKKWRSLVSGGTDNHLILLDVTKKNWTDTWVTGKTWEKALEEIGLSINKNMIPFDPRSPMDPSGLRIWTAAITSRGLGEDEITVIADLIDQALLHHTDADKLARLKAEVHTLCQKFPLWY